MLKMLIPVMHFHTEMSGRVTAIHSVVLSSSLMDKAAKLAYPYTAVC